MMGGYRLKGQILERLPIGSPLNCNPRIGAAGWDTTIFQALKHSE